MRTSKRDVAVIGGGIAGLSAAYALAEFGVDFALLEASNWLGGQIRTVESHGFIIEHGAEGFALQDDSLKQLIDRTHLTDRLASQITLPSFRVSGANTTPLEPGEAAQLLDLRIGPSASGMGLTTFAGGMAELPHTLAGRLGRDRILMGARAVSITRGRGLYRIEFGHGRAQLARSIIIAVSADESARLLAHLHEPTSRVFASLRPFSSVSVSLAYPRTAVGHRLNCSGFVMTGRARASASLRACSVVSEKFPGHAPEGWVLLRAFFRPGDDSSIDQPDDVWVDSAVTDLKPVLGLDGPPQHAWVSRWPRALYRHSDAELADLREVARQLGTREPIELAGAASDGDGVARAVSSGQHAVESLLSGLPSVMVGKGAT